MHLIVDNDVQFSNIFDKNQGFEILLTSNKDKSNETNELQPANNELAFVRLLVFQLLKSNETNELQPSNNDSTDVRLLVSNELTSNETNELQPRNMKSTFFNFILFVLSNFIDVILESPSNIYLVDISVKSRLDKSTEVTADTSLNELNKLVIFSSVS